MKSLMIFVMLFVLAVALTSAIYAETSPADRMTAQNTAYTYSETPDPQSEETEGLVLTVKLDEAALKTSGELSIDLFCKNLLDTRLRIKTMSPPLEYRIEFTGPDGRKLEEKRSFPSIHIRGAVLLPGISRKSRWELNRLFDIRDPGRYTLRAYRPVACLDGNGSKNLVSNLISFELTADDIAANARHWAAKLATNTLYRIKEEWYYQKETEDADATKPVTANKL